MKTDEDDSNYLILGEEDALLYLESSFKKSFTTIFQQCKELLKIYDTDQWKHLQSNPLFSAAFLTRLLKLYMLTATLWSNLLLGNFAHRYGYSSASTIPSCSCHFGRSTGVSKSRMRVLKEAILNNKVYSRVDEVIGNEVEICLESKKRLDYATLYAYNNSIIVDT
ncbi:hypothetical protein I4U23_031537 [Adineta vaga]|nr:hypothetical protein I4U23_031537 [Adineta vaga]